MVELQFLRITGNSKQLWPAAAGELHPSIILLKMTTKVAKTAPESLQKKGYSNYLAIIFKGGMVEWNHLTGDIR